MMALDIIDTAGDGAVFHRIICIDGKISMRRYFEVGSTLYV